VLGELWRLPNRTFSEGVRMDYADYSVVLTNGTVSDLAFYRPFLEEANFIIAADGGATIATRLGVRPSVLIGDFDSLPEEDQDVLSAQEVKVIRYPVHKDKTDSHLAVEYALKLSPRNIIILGPLRGRLDHTLANVGLLFLIRSAGKKGYLVDETNFCQLSGSECWITGNIGQLVSLIPLSEEVKGVSTIGLGYPLTGSTLRRCDSLGVSNFLVEAQARVAVTSGDLLIVQVR
jgi:thiamine pyrophosphokinase